VGKLKQSKLLLLVILGMMALAEMAIAQSARIENVSGNVDLQREGQSRYRLAPQRYGTPFNLGDLLILSRGAAVQMVCPTGGSALNRQSFSANQAETRRGLRQLCPSFTAVLTKDPPPPGLLGGVLTHVPYIRSPRHTLLVEAQPTFQWNAVPEAKHYKVRLRGSAGIVWEKDNVKTTTIVYDGSLVTGERYTLEVITNSGANSSQDGAIGVDFWLLKPPEVAAIQTEVATIKQAGLGEVTTAIRLAEFYAAYRLSPAMVEAYGLPKATAKSYTLVQDAIATLETLIRNQPQVSPEIYRRLGDLYWQSGLALPARDAYLEVIRLASSGGQSDREERVLAQEHLGDIYSAIRETNPAIVWYSQAQVNYLLLGDDQRAAGLAQKISELRR
jgi:hypothetical protein